MWKTLGNMWKTFLTYEILDRSKIENAGGDEMKNRYEIEQHPETENFLVLDNKSQIKVHHEDGSISQGRFIAGFKTKAEAEKFIDRMNLRDAWGI